jgi:hypothetical protein
MASKIAIEEMELYFKFNPLWKIRKAVAIKTIAPHFLTLTESIVFTSMIHLSNSYFILLSFYYLDSILFA